MTNPSWERLCVTSVVQHSTKVTKINIVKSAPHSSCEECANGYIWKDKKPSCAAKTGGAKKRKSSGKPVKPSKKPKNAKKSAKKRKAIPKPKNKPVKKSKKPTGFIVFSIVNKF